MIPSYTLTAHIRLDTTFSLTPDILSFSIRALDTGMLELSLITETEGDRTYYVGHPDLAPLAVNRLQHASWVEVRVRSSDAASGLVFRKDADATWPMLVRIRDIYTLRREEAKAREAQLASVGA